MSVFNSRSNNGYTNRLRGEIRVKKIMIILFLLLGLTGFIYFFNSSTSGRHSVIDSKESDNYAKNEALDFAKTFFEQNYSQINLNLYSMEMEEDDDMWTVYTYLKSDGKSKDMGGGSIISHGLQK